MPAIVPKSYAQCRRDYETLLDGLVAQWWALAVVNPWQHLHLLGERGRCSHNCAIWSRVWVGPESETGLSIRPEPIPAGATRERAREFFADILRREPLYVFAD